MEISKPDGRADPNYRREKEAEALVYLTFCEKAVSFAEVSTEVIGNKGLPRWKHHACGKELLHNMLEMKAVELSGRGCQLTERGRIAAAMAMVRKRV